MNEAAARALRIIAIAISDTPVNKSNPPKNLTLVCLACIRDTLRSTTKKAIRELQRAKIQVVMLTGDNIITAGAVAREAGIIDTVEGVYDASAIRDMTDEKLKAVLPSVRVIARSLPSDKSRLVRVAQETGMVVGMTGDGVNDAPALKRADVGFSLGSGSEIAKDAGDIVILNDDMASLSKAVLYGRTVFKSIRKFIVFQLTLNLCAVGISVLGPILNVEMPITVIQMLWVNMIMDSFAGLAFAGEPPLDCYMDEAPKPRDARVLTKTMLMSIGRMGFFTLLFCVLFLKLPIVKTLFTSSVGAFMCAFFTFFIFSGIFNAFSARTGEINLLKNLSKNKTFIIIMTATVGIQLLLIVFGGEMFRTVMLSLKEILTVLALSIAVIPAELIVRFAMKVKRRI